MHVIIIHATYMSSMNSRYHHISLQSIQLYLTLIEYRQRSRDRDPTLQQACESKLCLGTDKFNKWLKKPYLNTSPPRGNQSADWDYTSLVFTRRALGRIHLRGQWVHLKHRLSKREYKVVLSKTYVGAILLMHMYQGKREVGFNCRSASFDLASPELRVPDFEVRSVHESTTISSSNTPLWILPRLPHEKARHSTHTYLGKFYKYPVQVV